MLEHVRPIVSCSPTLPSITVWTADSVRQRVRLGADQRSGRDIHRDSAGCALCACSAIARTLVFLSQHSEYVQVDHHEHSEDQQHPQPALPSWAPSPRVLHPRWYAVDPFLRADVRLRTMAARERALTRRRKWTNIPHLSAPQDDEWPRIPPAIYCPLVSSWNFSPRRGKVRRKTWRCKKSDKPKAEAAPKKSSPSSKGGGKSGGGGRGGGGGGGDGGGAGEPGMFDASLEVEARRRYLNYALSVITSRALPDVRDGLKPVQRRILWRSDDHG